MYKITKENIKNHFITNPAWEEIFLKHYPKWTPENYFKNALELFNKNGYTITETRNSNNKKSVFYKVVEAELQKDGEFMFSLTGHIDSTSNDVILECICKYEIDFSTFK